MPAVQSFFHSQRSSSKLVWWTEIVAEFDVEIQYWPGHKNANADALSHSPIESSEDDDLLEVFQVTSAACEPNEGDREEWLKVVQEKMGKLDSVCWKLYHDMRVVLTQKVQKECPLITCYKMECCFMWISKKRTYEFVFPTHKTTSYVGSP